MLLKVLPTREFLSIPHNVTHLTGNITGANLGLVGECYIDVIMSWIMYFYVCEISLPVKWLCHSPLGI